MTKLVDIDTIIDKIERYDINPSVSVASFPGTWSAPSKNGKWVNYDQLIKLLKDASEEDLSKITENDNIH